MHSPDGQVPFDEGEGDPEFSDEPDGAVPDCVGELALPIPDIVFGGKVPEPEPLVGALAEDPRLPEAYSDPSVVYDNDSLDAELAAPSNAPPVTLVTKPEFLIDAASTADRATRGEESHNDGMGWHDDEEALGTVGVSSRTSDIAAFLELASSIRDNPTAEELAAGPGAEPAGAEPGCGQNDARAPCLMPLEQVSDPAGYRPFEAAGKPQHDPAFLEAAPGAPGLWIPVLGNDAAAEAGLALESRSPDASGPDPGDLAVPEEPGSDQQTQAVVLHEMAPGDDLRPADPDEMITDRAGAVLAALEEPHARPAAILPGDTDHDLPSRHAGAGAVPPDQVTAVIKGILGPAAGGKHKQEVAADAEGAELETLITAVVAVVREAGSGTVIDAIRAVTSDPETLKILRRIADGPEPSPEAVRRAAGQIQFPGGAGRTTDGRLIIAGLLLLAAGVAVPLFAGAAAEVMLTNEIAIAALIVSVAALRKS